MCSMHFNKKCCDCKTTNQVVKLEFFPFSCSSKQGAFYTFCVPIFAFSVILMQSKFWFNEENFKLNRTKTYLCIDLFRRQHPFFPFLIIKLSLTLIPFFHVHILGPVNTKIHILVLKFFAYISHKMIILVTHLY